MGAVLVKSILVSDRHFGVNHSGANWFEVERRMNMTFPELTDELLQLSVVVAAIVGVFKSYGVDSKHNHIIALVVSAVFVLVPDYIRTPLLTICIVALSASGAYHYVKNREKAD